MNQLVNALTATIIGSNIQGSSGQSLKEIGLLVFVFVEYILVPALLKGGDRVDDIA